MKIEVQAFQPSTRVATSSPWGKWFSHVVLVPCAMSARASHRNNAYLKCWRTLNSPVRQIKNLAIVSCYTVCIQYKHKRQWLVYAVAFTWLYFLKFQTLSNCIDISVDTSHNECQFHLHVGIQLVQLRSAGFGLHPFLEHTALIFFSGTRPGSQL